MAIWKGSITARRFVVEGDAPSTRGEGWRDMLRARLEEYAFRRPQRPMPGEESDGFVLPDNLLETDFSDTNRWHVGDYVLFGLRIDKTTLPKEKILAETKRRCVAFCKERGVERCPNVIRKQIQEAVEEELRGEARTKTVVVDCAWNLVQGYLLAGNTSTRVTDALRKRFFRAFGQKLVPTGPLREGKLPKQLGYEDGASMPTEPIQQFLSWLHLVSEHHDGRGGGDGDERTIFVTDRISFIGTKDTSSVQIKGESAGRKKEAKTAILDSRLVCDVKLELLDNEQPVGVLVAGGELFDLKSMRFLDVGEGTDSEDARVERMIFYEGLYAAMVDWAERFVEVRTDPFAWMEHLEQRRVWAESEEGTKDSLS